VQVSAHRTRMHSCARSSADLSRSQPISADLSRSRVRQLRISRSCTRAARSCSRSTPVARQIAIRLQSDAHQIPIRLQSTPVARQIPIRLQSESTHVRSTPRSDCNQRPSAAISGHRRLPKSIRGHQGLHITCCSSLNPASFRRASQHASHAPRGAEREHTGQSPPKSSRSGGKWAKQWST
jgi:hypothetical protein